MKLYEQIDDKGYTKTRKRKIYRRLKHKAERQASRMNLEDHVSTYNKYKGWRL